MNPHLPLAIKAVHQLAIASVDLLVSSDDAGVRPDGSFLVQAHTALANLFETGLRIVLPRVAPGCLDGRAQCRRLAVRGTDDRCIHDVGDDLSPQRVLRAAADQPDPFAVNTAVAQQVQAVTQAEGYAFEHGATEVGTGEVFACQPMQ